MIILLYWSLQLNTTLANFINNTKSEPIYLWTYIILTVVAILLFGLNISLLVYRIKKYGFPNLRSQTSTGLGSLFGVAASACPVCGSLILSAIGITAGLAAFPLQGLELKAASVVFLALPVHLTFRDLKRTNCGDSSCPPPKDISFGSKAIFINIAALLTIIVLGKYGWEMIKTDPLIAGIYTRSETTFTSNNKTSKQTTSQSETPLYDEVVKQVLSESGFQSKIVLGNAVLKLVQNGVIDRKKFENLYESRGGLPEELRLVFDEPKDQPILLTRENANYYINLLWPIGLSNYMSTNKNSPVNGTSLFNFASTGGWNLGKEQNGGAYFNKFEIVPLTPEQEALVTKIAQNTYRPCCNNSTFFQDCNHGSALLGVLQLGAATGLDEEELYKEALAFNSFWFPQQYIQTALFFKINKNTDWKEVNPEVILGYDYSANSNWSKNVKSEIAKIPDLLPKTSGGAGCGV